jgi:hypothetical protein
MEGSLPISRVFSEIGFFDQTGISGCPGAEQSASSALEIDRCYYELCALTELRNGLRSGDVWVVGSRRYGDFESYLIPKDSWTGGPIGERLPPFHILSAVRAGNR